MTFKNRQLISVALSTALLGTAVADERPQATESWYQDAQAVLQKHLIRQPNTQKAKNVILLVADGNGINSEYITRLFVGQKAGGYGDEHLLPQEEFPYLALAKTYNTNAQTPDSAGTATAMNTGVKVKAGVIGISDAARRSQCDDVEKATIPNFAELLTQEGKAIGVVSTARITHATPAAVYAHSGDRNWESAVPKGCKQKDIAQQLVDKLTSGGIDIALGGGARQFIPKDKATRGKRKDGRNLIQEAQAKGVAFVNDLKGLNAANLDGKTPLLGLFSSSHMSYEADRGDNQPSIAQMTEAAINYLANHPSGYYLVIEAGRVDHANHAGNAYRTVTDGEAFAKAVAKAAEMTGDDTLIIVTADHAHALNVNGYTGRGSNILGLAHEVNPNGIKHLENPTLAKDGKPYTIIGYLNGTGSILKKSFNYMGTRPFLTQEEATDPDYVQQALIPLASETHSGADVAIYAKGPWAHLFDGTVEQNYIFHVMDYAVHHGD